MVDGRTSGGSFRCGTSEDQWCDMDNRVHFSSATDLWATPWLLFRVLDAKFRFTCDVCALPENAKCKRFYTPDEDGLAQRWTGVCWMNPPYGREVGKWIRKAYESAASGDATVVCLIPARTDTSYWHDFVMRASEVWLVAGRIRFGDAKSGAPFPSAIVVFRPGELDEVPTLKGFSQN
jgi:phage N-6-adenine-methyltransferase